MVQDTSIESIVHSCGKLSSDETQRLETSVVSFQAQLESVDQELRWLRRRREVLRKGLVMRRSRMEPMQCVPPEIIAEILLWTCIRGRDIEVAGNRDQLLLLRVCRRWYDVAMSLPAFWSRLCLNLESYIFGRRQLRSMEAWLRRSGKCDIDLHISDGIDDILNDSEDEEILEARHRNTDWDHSTLLMIERLRPHLTRCKRIVLSMPPKYITKIIFSRPQGLPSAEYVSIRRPSLLSQGGLRTLTFEFSACQRLAEVRLCAPEAHFKFRGQGTSVRDIKGNMNQPAVLDLLRCCPFPTQCDITITEGMIFDDEPMLELPYLSELRITLLTEVELSEFGTLLDRLRLPSLHTLVLKLEYSARLGNRSQIWPHLTQLLRRSRPHLVDLQIHPLCFGQTELIQTLSCIPTLQSLSLSRFDPRNSFWRALKMTNDTSIGGLHNLCPELTNLDITGCTRISATAVAEMLLSRCSQENRIATPCKPLAVFHLGEVNEGSSVMKYPGISACIDAGLDLKIIKSCRFHTYSIY